MELIGFLLGKPVNSTYLIYKKPQNTRRSVHFCSSNHNFYTLFNEIILYIQFILKYTSYLNIIATSISNLD